MTQTTDASPSTTLSPARYPLWLACAAWAGVIFWFSTKPGTQIPGRFSEIGHFGEYFIFGALLYLALRASGRRDIAFPVALIAASLYGMTDEFHQHFVYMRTPDVTDWGMDTVGAACGISVARIVAALRARRRSIPPPAEKPA